MDANELARHKKPFMHELGGKTTKPSFACVVDEYQIKQRIAMAVVNLEV